MPISAPHCERNIGIIERKYIKKDGKELEKALTTKVYISCLFTVLLRAYILQNDSPEYNCTKEHLIYITLVQLFVVLQGYRVPSHTILLPL